ncbi:MAG: hypothetical protein RJB34_373 [Pseudomonadota bacterium]|jgi:beta-glucanase (GH16 family)
MDVASRAKNASLLSVFLLYGCGGGDTPSPMESPAPSFFTVGGTVAGLAPGQSLTLLNHGTDPLVVHSDGAVFAFTEAVAAGGTYNISVAEHPTGQVCSVTRPEGKDLAENVSNVAVVCEAAPAPASGLKLTWQDEFNHAEINQQVWSVANSARDQAWRSPKSVRLIDGYLDLRVFNKPNSTTHYSGFIQTQNKFDFQYGYIEARVRFKSQPGQWSAFWLMSPGAHVVHNPENPALGTEIDIIEHRSQDSSNKNIENSFITNIHWNGYGTAHKSYGSGLKALPAGQRFTDWKVLGLRWTPTQYTFYLDNKVYFNSTRAVSQSKQFIMLTNEVRNNSWAGAIPTGGYGKFESDANAWMQVDWVRLWQDN